MAPTSLKKTQGVDTMKKNNKKMVALLSAIITSAIPANLSAFTANLTGYYSEDLNKKLADYTKIDEAEVIEHPEYTVENGASYYINDLGQVKIVVPHPDYFTIELPLDVPDNTFEEIVNAVFTDATISKSNRYVETKLFIVSSKLNNNISIEQAKSIYKQFEDKAFDFKFHYGKYGLASPMYHFGIPHYPDDSKDNLLDFTIYKGIEKKEKLQAYIDESNINCHIKVDEKMDIIDVIPDNTLTYSEEITLASKIYKATGFCSEYSMTNNTQSITGGETIIDMHNFVIGDSNCDEQMDMADVVLIMQYLANPNKYQLSAQGSFNADFDDNGITVGDAQTIQEKLLGLE